MLPDLTNLPGGKSKFEAAEERIKKAKAGYTIPASAALDRPMK